MRATDGSESEEEESDEDEDRGGGDRKRRRSGEPKVCPGRGEFVGICTTELGDTKWPLSDKQPECRRCRPFRPVRRARIGMRAATARRGGSSGGKKFEGVPVDQLRLCTANAPGCRCVRTERSRRTQPLSLRIAGERRRMGCSGAPMQKFW